MRNNRGQALVEFVLVLPILLLLIFAFLDLGRVIVCKNHLEGVMSEVANLSDNEISNYLKKDSEYKISYEIKNGEYKSITLIAKIDLITPGLRKILKTPYTVKVERSIVYE